MSRKTDDSENYQQENSSPSETNDLTVVDRNLQYFKSEKRYVLFSIILPFLLVICQLLNFLLILRRYQLYKWILPGRRFIFDFVAPVLVFLVLAVFMTIHLFYLLKWDYKVRKYTRLKEKASSTSTENDSNTEEFVSLSQIYYDIISQMKSSSYIFPVLIVVSIIYLIWMLRTILRAFYIIRTADPPFPMRWFILNGIALAVLLTYIIIHWKNHLRWKRKLEKIEAFERRVYAEIDIDSES